MWNVALTGIRCALWFPLLDGYFPVNLKHPDQLAAAVAQLGPGHGVVAARPAGADLGPYIAAGATWWFTDFDHDVSLDTVRGVLREGPL